MSFSKVPFIDLVDRKTLFLMSGVAFLLIVGFAVGASGWDEFLAAKYFRKGLAAYEEGRFLEALAACQEASNAKPAYDAPRLLSLAVRMRAGEIGTPAALRKACGAEPALEKDAPAWARMVLAAADLAEGKIADGLGARLDKALQEHPNSAEACLSLAGYWARRGDFDRVEGFLRKILVGSGTAPPGWEGMIEAYLGLETLAERRGDWAGARRDVDAAAWIAGRRPLASSAKIDASHARVLTVQIRRTRLDLLERLAAGSLAWDALADAESLLARAEKASGVDPVAAGRLANLVGIAARTWAASLAGASRAADLRALSGRMSAAVGRWLPGEAGSPSPCDLVALLNRLAVSSSLDLGQAPARLPVDSLEGKTLDLWKATYRAIAGIAIPAGASSAVSHNRAILDYRAGEGQDLTVKRLEEVVRCPEASAVAWRNLGILYEQMGLPDKAADSYRRSLALDPAGEDVARRAAALGVGGNR